MKKKSWNQFSSFINISEAWVIFPWLAIFFLFIVLLFLAPLSFFNFFGTTKNAEYQTFYYFFSLALTALLLIIAFIQLRGLKERMRADFLLNIDLRWGNAENLKARTIIHEFYLNSEEKHGGITTKDNSTLIFDDVGHQILNLRKSKNNDDPEKFVSLLNYLDFMETIGYLYNSKYVTLEDLQELCGYSLKFNYEIFRLYIKDKTRRHGKDNFYKFFALLYDDLNKCLN